MAEGTSKNLFLYGNETIDSNSWTSKKVKGKTSNAIGLHGGLEETGTTKSIKASSLEVKTVEPMPIKRNFSAKEKEKKSVSKPILLTQANLLKAAHPVALKKFSPANLEPIQNMTGASYKKSAIASLRARGREEQARTRPFEVGGGGERQRETKPGCVAMLKPTLGHGEVSAPADRRDVVGLPKGYGNKSKEDVKEK